MHSEWDNITSPSKYNVTELCRFCLGTHELCSIFSDLRDEVHSISDKIDLYLPFKVTENDALSTKVCDQCTSKLSGFHEFVGVAVNAQKQLESWLAYNNSIQKDLHQNVVDQTPSTTSNEIWFDNEITSSQSTQLPIESTTFVSVSTLESASCKLEGCADDSNVVFVQPSSSSLGTSDTSTDPLNSTHLLQNKAGQQEQMDETEISDKSKDLQCPHCENKFSKKLLLRKHVKEEHAGFVCGCGAKFTNKRYLSRHLSRHNTKPSVPCKLCNKLFLNNYEMKEHQKSHQVGRKLSCTLCKYTTLYHSNLSRHIKRHNNDFTVFCDECSQGFYSKDELTTHQIKFHGATPFYCLLCRKSFNSRSYLHEHNKNTHGNLAKNYLCETCGKSFKTKTSTKRHMKTHMNNKYSCELCHKTVTSAYSLKNHVKAHKGEKNVVCYICGKAFVDNRYMSAHIRSHTGERPYCCELCGKRFTQATTLKVHTRYHTGERPYVCGTCGSGFVTRSLLKNHTKSHPGITS